MSQGNSLAPGAAPAGIISGFPLTSRQRFYGGLAALILATFCAYLPAMQGQFIWDDEAHVTKPELRSLDGLFRIWFELDATQQYYPLLHTAFWIEHRLWGDDPLGYHLVNVLWHALAACLVYLVLRKLQIPGAYLAAAIFALHPVQVESVAWITEQKNTLSAVFYLCAMLAYLKFDETRRRNLYGIALLLFVLALLTKTVTATLPAALLLIFWWQRGKLSWRNDVVPLVPWFVMATIAGLFTAWVEHSVIGAVGADFELSPAQRLLIAGRVPWFYLHNLLWPADLIFIYPRWNPDASAGWQWLYPLATAAVLLAFWAIHRKWRAPLTGCLFFVGTLFPVLGFFNVYPFAFSFVADHFQYLACLGVIVLSASGLALVARRLPPHLLQISLLLGVVLVGTLTLLTWRQCEMYSDVIHLYQTTINRNPNCWMAYINITKELTAAGRTDEAIERSHQALALRPNYPEAHNNLGAALAKAGRLEDAVEQFQQAVLLKPDYSEAFDNLGIALGRLTRIPEAIVQFQKALNINPNYADAHYNLGLAFFKNHQPQEAIDQFEVALRLQPNNAKTHVGLAGALALEGRFQEAVEHYHQGLQLNPQITEACFHLAETYAQMQQPTQAIAAAQQAIDLARSQGQTAQESQIQAWLDAYRAQSQSRNAHQ